MKYPAACLAVITAAALLLAACNDKKTESSSISSASNSSATNSIVATAVITTDAWSGKWNGPEGTFLEISGSEGKYTIIIQDLDGPKTYQGIGSNNQIEFERNGATETLRATNGAETGMKWLADKTNCLTVRTGEGYCRD